MDLEVTIQTMKSEKTWKASQVLNKLQTCLFSLSISQLGVCRKRNWRSTGFETWLKKKSHKTKKASSTSPLTSARHFQLYISSLNKRHYRKWKLLFQFRSYILVFYFHHVSACHKHLPSQVVFINNTVTWFSRKIGPLKKSKKNYFGGFV